MIKFNVKRLSVFTSMTLIFLGAFVLVSPAKIYAHETGEPHHENPTISDEKKAEIEKKQKERQAEVEKKKQERESELEAKKKELETKREEVKEKFTEKRLEACQKKEERINSSMQKIAERRAKQLEVFNKIADRTMAFYDEKGLALSNYDALVADVNAKRANAEAEIASLKESTVDFNCESDDPLKVSEAFKVAREGVVSAMKDYKTSVKNLIVGVKSVTPDDSENTTEGAN